MAEALAISYVPVEDADVLTVWVVLWAIAIEGPPPNISTETLLILLLLGLLPTAMANFIRVVLIREAGPVFLGITNYIVPLWAAMVGVIASISLLFGSAIAIYFRVSSTVIGLMAAFGAGALLSALALELVAPTIYELSSAKDAKQRLEAEQHFFLSFRQR